ncbi:serine hydrolase domain-containing protein [Mariniphaga sp.]|uniref:serine hydrolase domain-containing protein n=1 Tax=Mariniphaga sp. TaxID=1954475 RepID=UPI003567FF9B
MKKQRFFALLIFLFFVLLTTTNQRISSSPDILQENIEIPPSQSEKELTEMQDVFEEYNQWLSGEIEKSGTIGAAVAITYKDQIAFIKCFGTRKSGSSEPVDEHTVFRLASVSKPVTGVLTGILAQENILDFDECVIESLPGFRLNSLVNTQNLTIKNLLSHTTGLVPHAYDDLVEGHVPFSTIYERLRMAGISAEPGKMYGYQNVMFSLLDTILAVKTSKNYSQLVKEKLFERVGMHDASTDFESFKNNPNKAYPHWGNGSRNTLPLNDRYYNTAPAAGVNASVSDMAHFLLALLNENNPLLKDDIQEAIFQPQVVSPLSRGYFKYWENVGRKNYGLGWRIVDYKSRKVAYHGGYVHGYKAEIALCKQEDIGIVYLTNSPNSVASQSIPEFFNRFFNYKENKTILAETEPISEELQKIQGS